MGKNKRNPILKNKKSVQHTKTSICFQPRCYWSKGTKKQSESVLIKCGDCDNKLYIYFDKKDKKFNDIVEIGGVFADKKWWKLLFEEIGIIKEGTEK